MAKTLILVRAAEADETSIHLAGNGAQQIARLGERLERENLVPDLVKTPFGGGVTDAGAVVTGGLLGALFNKLVIADPYFRTEGREGIQRAQKGVKKLFAQFDRVAVVLRAPQFDSLVEAYMGAKPQLASGEAVSIHSAVPQWKDFRAMSSRDIKFRT